MAEVTVRVRGEDIKMGPGDSVDLGDQGIVRWLVEEDAAAERLVTAKRQRETRRAIDVVEQRAAAPERHRRQLIAALDGLTPDQQRQFAEDVRATILRGDS